MKRHKMPNRSAQRLFTRTANKVKSVNYRGTPMRGGIRL